jgi:hypothetical protein
MYTAAEAMESQRHSKDWLCLASDGHGCRPPTETPEDSWHKHYGTREGAARITCRLPLLIAGNWCDLSQALRVADVVLLLKEKIAPALDRTQPT